MGEDRLIPGLPPTNSMESEADGHDSPSASSIFERECGYYLHLGMSLEDYWDGDPEIVRWYRDKERQDLEHENWLAWLNGRYIYETMLAVSPAIKAFVKNPRPVPYMQKPHELFKAEGKELEMRKQQEMQQGFATFKAMADRINQNKHKGGDETDGN